MASIHKRPGSPYFYAAFRGPDRRLVLRSTKQTARSKATETALAWERAAKLAARGELVEAQARSVLSDLMKRVGEQGIQAPAAGVWLREWLDGVDARRSPSTTERYRGVIDRFIDQLGDRADRPLSCVGARDVEAFITGRLRDGCSPSTVQVDGKVLLAALNRARRLGLIASNPAEAVKLPEREGVERGTFTPAEVEMLVTAAPGEWKTMILLGYYAGARLSDCAALEWDNVDLTAGTITIRQTKTKETVLVPMHPTLAEHLAGLASTDTASRFVMPGMSGQRVGGCTGLSKAFLRIMREAGIDSQQVQGSGMRRLSRRSFHSLRHTFNSTMHNAGVSQEVRMRLTGHKTAAVNRGYTHTELATLREAVATLPELAH